MSIEEVIAFLEEHAKKPSHKTSSTPSRLGAPVSGTGAAGSAAVVTLEAADERLAREIVTDPRLRAFQLERVGARGVAIPPRPSARATARAGTQWLRATAVERLRRVGGGVRGVTVAPDAQREGLRVSPC